MAKTMDVPAFTPACQLYVEGPVGGLNWNEVPPGMYACNEYKFAYILA